MGGGRLERAAGIPDHEGPWKWVTVSFMSKWGHFPGLKRTLLVSNDVRQQVNWECPKKAGLGPTACKPR